MRERDHSDFLTVAEVAAAMRLSRATVYRLMRDHELQAVRFGRTYRIPEAAVAEYIARAVFGHGDGGSSALGGTENWNSSARRPIEETSSSAQQDAE